MDWKEYFHLTLFRETLQGNRPYFEARLQIPSDFSIDELNLKEFGHLSLTDHELKKFSLTLRKIYLRHKYFRSIEFQRIVQNLAEKIAQEKDQLLTFSTSGGGIYLILALSAEKWPFLLEKKLICYTSEMPLRHANLLSLGHLHVIYRPTGKTYFKHFPTLWQSIGDNSVSIDLCKVSLA